MAECIMATDMAKKDGGMYNGEWYENKMQGLKKKKNN